MWVSLDTFCSTITRLNDQSFFEEAQKPFELFKKKNWLWRLVHDPSFTSAREREQKGHDVLDYLSSALDENMDHPGLQS